MSQFEIDEVENNVEAKTKPEKGEKDEKQREEKELDKKADDRK